MADEDKVEVGSLEPGQSFKLNNKKYTVSAVYPFGVMVVPLKPKEKPVEKLPIETLVRPIIEQEDEPGTEPTETGDTELVSTEPITE